MVIMGLEAPGLWESACCVSLWPGVGPETMEGRTGSPCRKASLWVGGGGVIKMPDPLTTLPHPFLTQSACPFWKIAVAAVAEPHWHQRQLCRHIDREPTTASNDGVKRKPLPSWKRGAHSSAILRMCGGGSGSRENLKFGLLYFKDRAEKVL